MKSRMTLISLFSLLATLLLIIFPITTEASDSLDNVNYGQEVIYQIMTDRFKDGNPNNNPQGELFSPGCVDLTKYCGGDWQGIIDKIQDGYLIDMGITALWISPPVENVMDLHPGGFASYHGYWARDFKRVNQSFGSLQDFEELVAVAHQNNLKIIIDFVPNHTSPVDIEDGVLYDDGQFVGYYSNDLGDYFYTNGGSDFSSYEDSIYRNLYDLASLNQQNPFIDRYLKEAIQYWLDLGIDGIRIDAVAHMPVGWQKNFVSSIYDHNPVFTFGEWFTGQSGSPEYHHFVNESGMSALDFRFAQVVQDVLRNYSGTMYDLNNMIQDTEISYDRPQDQVTFIDNHDINRFSQLGESTRTTDIGLGFLLTSRGVPTIYYGTEAYMTGDGDPQNRQMMDDFNQGTNAYQIINKLSHLRQSNMALSYGTTKERWINEDVLIYERSFNDDYALIAINRNLNQSYQINNLITNLPADTYQDELNGLIDGQAISVSQSGSVSPFTLKPGELAVWQSTSVNKAAPEIGQVGPPLGKPGDKVRIDGSGFGQTQGAVHLGERLLDIVSWSDTSITVTLPSNGLGKEDLLVTTSNGVDSQLFGFEMLTNKQTAVRFVAHNANTNLGENLYIVGDVPELGSWDPNKAIGPMFNQVMYSYPSWYYDVNVPINTTIEYKYIIKDQSGNVRWESGVNHQMLTSDETKIVESQFRQ